MLGPEYYRSKARELRAQAKDQSDAALRLDSERLAASYERLAEQLSAAVSDSQKDGTSDEPEN